ncbi:MAG: 50S ribosomal protein L18e [Candidatus Heimdallarchaeaceae archaeon]
MIKKTGTTDPNLIKLINNLKKKSSETKVALWKAVAKELEKPRRKKVATNLSKINRYTKENDVVVVPGSVLGSGNLSHKLTIAALRFSSGAKEKLDAANCHSLLIDELLEGDYPANKIKIII